MPLTLKELKKLHDDAYNANVDTREKAANDLVFYYLTQWDDNILDASQLAYRGEFNILKKAGREILAGLAANPIQVDFEASPGTNEDSADVLDGIYREEDVKNDSIEAYNNADAETVVCGMGAWELYTEYVNMRGEDNRQKIKRRPIFEANNTAFPDPNAKLMDRSDGKYWSLITAYTEEAYKTFVSELTGEDEEDVDLNSFDMPNQSLTFPWIVKGKTNTIYVGTIYHKSKITDKLLTFSDPFGQTKSMLETDLEPVMDELLDLGFEIVSEKEITRWQIRKYIFSGKEILNGEMGEEDEREGEIIPGEYIPIVPEYGEHAYVEGQIHYEGVTRCAKDPQRLRNFQLSYLADIVSQSPRQKPIFFQEQIAGFEDLYTTSGAENNYAYLLQNRTALDGTPLPVGPVGVMPEQKMPDSLIASITLTREALEDVAKSGAPQDIADPDLSGKAVLALQARIDMQSVVYQEHRKHAKRYDAMVFASMASEIYDVPQEVAVRKKDGTRTTAKLIEQVIDKETGKLVTLKDLRESTFDVYSTIGPSYASQKEQVLDRLEAIRERMAPGDPMANAIMLKSLTLLDGVAFDDIRQYANKQLLLAGIRQPETPEEEQFLAEQAAKTQQPSAEMVLAMAEMKKGEAAHEKNQLDLLKMQVGAQNESQKRIIDQFRASTDRMGVLIDAQETGVKIKDATVATEGKQLDNAAKILQLKKSEIEPLKSSSSDELFAVFGA